MTTFTVPLAYQGITGVAHGGYVAGLLAGRVGGHVRVALRRPPPLDTPLTVRTDRLCDQQGRTVMEVEPLDHLDGELPLVTLEEARSRTPHPRFASHPYAGCFVCGTTREDGFDLRVSEADGEGVAAAVWVPSGPLLNDDEEVAAEFLWATVDCVTVWSFADRWEQPEWWPALTGRIGVAQLAPVIRDRPHVAVGRVVARDGRKISVDAAITDADGELCARGRAVWVVVPENP